MRVLVTGATGYIGGTVCHFLKAAGHQAIGFVRTNSGQEALQRLGFEVSPGDLGDPRSLRAATEGVDAVIHTAMQLDAQAGDLDRQAVETLLAALAGSDRTFLYTSGVWVMGDTKGRMLGEVSVLAPPLLVAWRPAVEEMVLHAADSRVRGMVVRPGMVYGRQGGILASFFQNARGQGAVRIVGSGENHWSTVHVEDLAQLYVHMVENPCGGELFLATGGMPQPVKKVALAVAKACGVEGRVESVALEQARAEMGPVADCLAMDQKAGSTKAARFFGWSVRKPSIFEEIFTGSYLTYHE
jgi:nucleoside-diphosphate-sugar epimerase